MNKIAWLFLLFLCFSFAALAQNHLDIMHISGRYGFPQPYVDTYNEKATEFGTYLSLTVPVSLTEKTIWYNSFNHFYFNVDGDPGIPEKELNPIKLNGFILRTGLYQKFNKGTAMQLLFVPRYMTDFENADGKSFQAGGVFLLEKVYHPNLSLSYGVMYNQEFFGPYVVPLLNLYWKLSDKWFIKGLFPITLKVNYLAGKNLSLGLSHFGLITSYYLGEDLYKGDYMERKSIDLSLFFRQRLTGNFYIEGKAGRTFGRSYTQYAGDQKVDFSLPLIGFGDEREAKNTTFNDGFFVEIGIAYSINLDDR